MRIYSSGKMLQIPPRGPAGPDGNPIGTVISYMGQVSPKNYLVCDGAVYPVSEYPELAEFFRKQFGSVNYFGGDGMSTFAVPDMRNLFLRGYHGEAEEQLSGEIGVKQDATEIVNLPVDENFVGWYGNNISPNNVDAWSDERSNYRRVLHNATSSSSSTNPSAHTTRPVNMAVLYCIKAVKSIHEENIYSTEETVIGRWIDGKPLYRKTFLFTTPATTSTSPVKIADISELNIDTPIKIQGMVTEVHSSIGYIVPISTSWNSDYIHCVIRLDKTALMIICNVDAFTNCKANASIEYTKTTD